jgi:WD40 repeat protein
MGTVHVRDLPTGKPLAEFSDRIGWPDPSEYPVDRLAAFSPDGKQLVLAGSGHSVKIWNWRQAASEPLVLGDPRAEVAAGVAIFNADGERVAIRESSGNVAIWNTRTGQRQTVLPTGGPAGGAWTMAFNRDGTQMVTGMEQPGEVVTAQIWNAVTGDSLARLEDGGTVKSADGTTEMKSPMLEQHIRVAWTGDRIVTVNFNLGIGHLWDAGTHARLLEFNAGGRSMELAPRGGEPNPRLAMAANGERFIVAGMDGSARVYNAVDAQLLATFIHPFPNLDRAELSANGATALTADTNGHMILWTITAPEPVVTDPGVARINEAHLTADGRAAAAACSDHCVRLWSLTDPKSPTEFREEKPAGEGTDTLGAPLDSNSARVFGFLTVQVDPHGFWVAAIDDNGRLCVWEMATRRQLLRWKLEPASRNVRLTADPTGRFLIVTGMDGAARLFHLGGAE